MSQVQATRAESAAATERAEHAEAKPANNGMMLKGGVVLGVAAFMGVAMFSLGSGGAKRPAGAAEKISINKGSVFEPAPVPPPPPAAPALAVARPVPMPVPQAAPEAPKGPDMMDLARRAPLTAYTKQSRALGDGRVMGWSSQDDAKPEDNGTFGKLLRPTQLDAAHAGHIGNRDFVIAMGTSIPCVLETAMSSDQPGFSTCVINRDVMSDNGRVVLLEKGTQVIGEYRGGLKQGQQRLFVLWTRAKTPTGVIVALGSPATDSLGRAGFDGQVDNHWWERFGSALLLSVVSDASSQVTQRLSATGVQANQTGQSGKQAAGIAVEQSGSMAPTLNKHHGELVSIMVGRDLDFTAVYKLRMVPRSERGPSWSTPITVGGQAGGGAFGAKILNSLKD